MNNIYDKGSASIMATAFALILGGCNENARKEQRPNILFIIADDLSWEHLGVYGCTSVKTPNIDLLAEEGVLFTNSFVNCPSCSPSRASILTGRNGFELQQGAALWGYLPKEYPVYPELLENSGYRAGATGKGWGPGFLVDRDRNPAGKLYDKKEASPYKEFPGQINISHVDYSANFETFLSENNDDPFCFWVGAYEPHRGYTVGLAATQGPMDHDLIRVPGFLPDTMPVKEDISEYLFEVEHIDREVGEIMDVLKRKERFDNTIVVFTSDNGMPFPRAKATLYDHGTRMPLIIWWNKNIDGGRRISDMVSHTDLAPTFLEAAGLAIPDEISGRSLLPLLKSDRSGMIDSSRKRVVMYRERHAWSYPRGISFPSRALRTDEYLLIWNPATDILPSDVDGGPSKNILIDNRERYSDLYDLAFGEREEFELYRVNSDPYQLNNLANEPDYQVSLDKLKSDLFKYLEERADPRILGQHELFDNIPYFGHLFEQKMLVWEDDRDGRRFSEKDIYHLLKEAYLKKGELEAFHKMAEQENWDAYESEF